MGNFQPKKFDFFLIFAQNIDRGYWLEPPHRGGSNEYPQSMFWIKNKKNWYTPVNPSFTIKKWDMRGYTFHGHVFLMSIFTHRLFRSRFRAKPYVRLSKSRMVTFKY